MFFKKANKDLEDAVSALDEVVITLIADVNQLRDELHAARLRISTLEGWNLVKKSTITVSTSDAPWGYKKNGELCKKPGRKVKP